MQDLRVGSGPTPKSGDTVVVSLCMAHSDLSLTLHLFVSMSGYKLE